MRTGGGGGNCFLSLLRVFFVREREGEFSSSGGGKGAVRACRAKGPLLLSHTSHPHILWGIRGTFAKSVVFAKVRCAAAAVLAASISPRHPLPPPLSLNEEGVGLHGILKHPRSRNAWGLGLSLNEDGVGLLWNHPRSRNAWGLGRGNKKGPEKRTFL